MDKFLSSHGLDKTMLAGYVMFFLTGIAAAKLFFPGGNGKVAVEGDNEGLRNDFRIADGPGKMVLVVNQVCSKAPTAFSAPHCAVCIITGALSCN